MEDSLESVFSGIQLEKPQLSIQLGTAVVPSCGSMASSESPGGTDLHRLPSTSPREAKAIQFEEILEICALETFSLGFSRTVESIAIRRAELMEFFLASFFRWR